MTAAARLWESPAAWDDALRSTSDGEPSPAGGWSSPGIAPLKAVELLVLVAAALWSALAQPAEEARQSSPPPQHGWMALAETRQHAGSAKPGSEADVSALAVGAASCLGSVSGAKEVPRACDLLHGTC
eukprot:7379822-Prymnesium_polylepis.2